MRPIRKKLRGFTLVELMIVVAIIGILAALAIYGVRRYITNAKTAEVRAAVGRLAKDAGNVYNNEGMSTAVMALQTATGVSHRICGSASAAVPASAANIRGKKYQSSPADWETGDQWTGWRCVRFSMGDPQYYQYNYTAAGMTTNAAGTTGFTAIGAGDLDGDSTLSQFSLGALVRADASGNLVLVVAPNIAEQNPDE